MTIEIRKLTPDLAEDYIHFFDVTPHDNHEDCNKCYCVTWRSGGWSGAGNDHWFPTREERRAHALEYVKAGYIQGYLAYCGEEIVGWCNASADCGACVDYLRAFWPVGEHPAGAKVMSIFCFAIAPQMQRQGIATQLLQRACEDAAADGLDFVEAYINEEFADTSDFRGPLAMYKACGFHVHAKAEGRVVVRKALK